MYSPSTPEQNRGPRGKGTRRKFNPEYGFSTEVFAMLAEKVASAATIFDARLETEGVRPIRIHRRVDPNELDRIERYSEHLDSVVKQTAKISRGRKSILVNGWYPEIDNPYFISDKFAVTFRPADAPVSVTSSSPQFQLRMAAFVGEAELNNAHDACLTIAPERALNRLSALPTPYLNISIVEAWKNTLDGLVYERNGAGIGFIYDITEKRAFAHGLIHAGMEPAFTSRIGNRSCSMNLEEFIMAITEARQANATYHQQRARVDLTQRLLENPVLRTS